MWTRWWASGAGVVCGAAMRCNRYDAGNYNRVGDHSTVLVFGEVHTALLQNSTALARHQVTALLDRVDGERARRFDRPIPHVVSPDDLTGVDCVLPSAVRRDTRCVGTVVGHTAVTGGHIVQGSARTCLSVVRRSSHRLPWSHYLTRPGTVESIGKTDVRDVALGFLAGPRRDTTLDVGAVSRRLVDGTQASPLLDRRPPFRSSRTTLRWVLLPATGEPTATFTIEDGAARTLTIRLDDPDREAVAGLCADLALHDWLLTTLVSLLDKHLPRPGPLPQRVRNLGPAVESLLHLWMPAARTPASLLPLWEELDQRSKLSRQWHTSVDRLRDHLALSTISLLAEAGPPLSSGGEEVRGPI